MEISVQVFEEFVAVAGGTLYVRRWAPEPIDAGAQVPVVLLHDSIGCVDMWRQFPLALAKKLRRTVIAYDRLGFGRSSARHDLPSVRFVSEEAEIYFPAVKRQLGIDKFSLFGHSVGGGMAVVIAAKFPDDCRAVVTESAQAFVEAITLKSIAEGKQRFAAPQELAKLERYHGDKASWVVRAWTDTWLSPEFAAWNLRSELPGVKCPLLAIHGEHDEYGTAAFPDVLSSMTSGPAQKMIVKDCGHIPHREKEALLLDAVETFLRCAV